MYDLIVIGSGPAGEKGAAQAAYFGKSVALVEREPVLGGACVNTGTVPSKTLRESALHLSGFRMRAFGDAIGLTIKDNITVGDFMRRKQIVVEREWQRIEANLRRHMVDRYSGIARFLAPHKIEITNALGTQEVEGNIILIATGSSPFRPSNVPFDDEFICDSDSILGIDQIPRTLAVVGAGVIGCEYASIFAALGVEVHLIDGRTSLLPQIDREIIRILIAEMQQRLGVVMHLGSDVEEIDRCEHEVALTLKDGREVVCDKVLYAAGRSSNTADLNLEAAGVQSGNRGLVVVDENYRTNVPNIYAAGDVIGFPALASTSMEQARVAMVHAFDLKYKTHIAPLLPYAIYTIPELATVGLTEDDCRKKGITPGTGRAAYRNNARGQIIGDTQGMIKIVFDRETLAILGVHIVGENASELLHTGMMAMQFGGTINAFIDCVFNFPALGEAYKYAAYDGLGSLALKPKA
ncbi:MAG TPA: Si-specific NAD(P)(+) transhydrogenase [Thermoanaerobaculia bacterium]|jgi:NAD(P) transhydrogenase|nr:Si-specific NAD(P)(+) transhydrogenase [Thermoanaerobaculia bacterium]